MADRAQVPVRREQKLQAINLLWMSWIGDFPGERSIFRAFVRYDLGLLVRGTAAESERPSRVKAGHVARRMSECRLDAG